MWHVQFVSMPVEWFHVSKIVEASHFFHLSNSSVLAGQIEVERFSEFCNVTEKYLVDKSVKTKDHFNIQYLNMWKIYLYKV